MTLIGWATILPTLLAALAGALLFVAGSKLLERWRADRRSDARIALLTAGPDLDPAVATVILIAFQHRSES